jgi:hypothetical protein
MSHYRIARGEKEIIKQATGFDNIAIADSDRN